MKRPPVLQRTEGDGRPELRYKEKKWKVGVFRLVDVKALLKKTPEIRVMEHRNIKYPCSNLKKKLEKLQYVAISHVWKNSVEAKKNAGFDPEFKNFLSLTQLRKQGVQRQLGVQLKERGKFQAMSWKGLVQMARAADKFGSDWMWIDLLCINQATDEEDEMDLQICLMRDIYEWAVSVVVMVGGVLAAQSPFTTTGWMDRAWTLQESIVHAKKETWVLVTWPDTQNSRHVQDKDGNRFELDLVKGDPGLRLIHLETLLKMSGSHFKPPYAKITALDGEFASSKMSGVPRNALRSAMSHKLPLKAVGIWRCMFLRTSSKPVDIVYSVMHAFGLTIDPFRKKRDYEYLYRDLARKVAAMENWGPSWLSMDSITGSKILRDTESRLLPRCPVVKPEQSPFARLLGKKRATEDDYKWIGHSLGVNDHYINRFDVEFITHSQPHVINAGMFSFGPNSRFEIIWGLKDKNSKRIARIKLSRNHGKLHYRAPDLTAASKDVKIVYVGEVGVTELRGVTGLQGVSNFAGGRFMLILQWDLNDGGWRLLGDGVFVPDQESRWTAPDKRYIFTLGKGAQTRIFRWPAPEEGDGEEESDYHLDRMDERRRFDISYGVVPLRDWNHSSATKKAKIFWAYQKGLPIEHERWKPLPIKFKIGHLSGPSLKARFSKPQPLSIISTKGSLPRTVPGLTRAKIKKIGALLMKFADGRWKRSKSSSLALAEIEGVVVPKPQPGKTITSTTYRVAVIFGECMIYLMSKPDARTRWEFTKIAVIPYIGDNKSGIGGKKIIPARMTPKKKIPQRRRIKNA